MLKLVPGVGTAAGTAIQAVTGGALTLALGIEYTSKTLLWFQKF